MVSKKPALLYISLVVNFLFVSFFLVKRIYFSHPFKKTSYTVAIIGDSRVADVSWPEYIMNCGKSGIITLQCNVDTVIKNNLPKCIIQVGINDLRMGKSTDSVIYYYGALVDKLLSKQIQPFITSVIPIRKDFWQDDYSEAVINSRVDSVNARLKDLAAKKGVKYIDIDSKLTDGNRLKREYTKDGIHLNDAGYQIVFAEIKSNGLK